MAQHPRRQSSSSEHMFTYIVNVQYFKFLRYAVPHNNRYTLLLENISLYFVLKQVFELLTALSFFLRPIPYFIPSLRNVTVLHYNVFTKAVRIQSNRQLALSRLMHSIHCGSAIFTYQALERRPARDCMTKISKALKNHSQ
jgi:hypothetical protein